VYKLYAIIDETRLPGGEAGLICSDFLSALLPVFDAAMFGGKDGAGPTPPGEKPPAATATDPAETAVLRPAARASQGS
jgi:hypothetical protein